MNEQDELAPSKEGNEKFRPPRYLQKGRGSTTYFQEKSLSQRSHSRAGKTGVLYRRALKRKEKVLRAQGRDTSLGVIPRDCIGEKRTRDL